jgi:phosphoglycolate phosphatase-like HAD superfamily hydrolase/ADP-ribose pyrophosphatase YjhB (NUDIX family)
MIRNIIFDWSGTLVDDLPAALQATNYVLTQAQRPEMTLEQFRAEFCLPFTIFYDRHVPHVPFGQLEVWFHARFREAQSSVCPLPHAREFLQFCREKKIRTFLLSSVHQDHYEAQDQVIGFGAYLEQPYLNVWDKRAKIHEILEENSLSPEETLFIGDMQHDIDTARHGGIHSCAVLTGYNTLDQLRAANPDLIVEHLRELQELFQQTNWEINRQIKPFEESHPPIVTVGALILNDAGQALMIRTQKWSNLWGIPGGKTKWGETSEAALRREIKEETNLDVEDIRFVLVQDCIHSREFYRDAHFVLLNYICRARGELSVRLNDEAREYRWVETARTLELPLNTPTRILLDAVLARGAK